MGKHPEELIKDGEKTAVITVRLADKNSEKEIHIERKITASNVYLKATDNHGKPLLQADLDAMLSDFTIDPLAFTRLKNKEQVEFVKKIAGIDTTEIDEEYKKLYDERTFINRHVDEKKTLLANVGNIENVEKKDITALVTKRAEMIENNNKIETLTRRIQEGENQIASDIEQIQKLQQMIQDLEGGVSKKQQLVLDLKLESESMEIIDTTAIDTEIKTVESNNAKVAQYDEYKALKKEYDEWAEKSENIQNQMDKLNQDKVDMVTNAKLPLEGLSFDDEVGLLIDGIPFVQKSSAEQLRISTQLAMAFDPELRVLYVKDGSLLDIKTITVFQEMAKEKDYMVLVEVVGDISTEGAIVMRAGNASVNGL